MSMQTQDALLESWRRQCQIVQNITLLVTPQTLSAAAAPGESSVAGHLAHIHSVRRYWHMKAAHLEEPVGPSLFTVSGDDWVPSHDIAEIQTRLYESERLVGDWVKAQLEAGAPPIGHYDHPVLYLQHIVWHEGWHCGAILLALRLNGVEPSEEWECEKIWDLWRLPD